MKKSIPLLILFISFFCFANGQNWLTSMDQARTLAKKYDKLILIDFYADWCTPCKKMDIETWSQVEVRQQTQKFITTKIDIDVNKSLASRYGIKAIPTVIIVDSWGNVIHKETGYNTATQMTKLLSGFPDDINILSAPMEKLSENKKAPDPNFEVGLAYQKIAKTLSGQGKDIFAGESNAYLSKAGRSYKKEKNVKSLECVDLMKCYNKILKEQSKSAMKEMDQINFDDLQDCNKALACFIMVNGYMNLQDKKNAVHYFGILESCENSAELMEELKTSYPELADS